MPDSSVTEERLVKAIRKHIEQLGVNFRCPVCGGVHFAVNPPEQAMGHTHGGAVIGAPVVPYVTVVCQNCFHLIHFAWLPIREAAGLGEGDHG